MRPPLPEVPYDEPTEEERRLGSWFQCVGCDRPWPLRLADVRERRHCVNCGRRRRREKQADVRRRARYGIEQPPAPAPAPAAEAAGFSDPTFLANLSEGRVPEDVEQELDRLIMQAVEAGSSRRRAR